MNFFNLFAARSAIFIDFDNVGSDAMRRSIPNWMAWLESGAFRARERRRKFVVRNIYWNGKKDEHREFFEKHGFEAFACRPIATNKLASNDKSASDLRLAVHAVDHLYRTKGLKEVFIFSCDMDFVPLVDLLRERGVRVVALGNENDPSSAVYRDHADHVISVRELKNAFTYDGAKQKRRDRDADVASLPAAAPAANAPAAAPAAPVEAASGKPVLEQAADLVVNVASRTAGLRVGKMTITQALSRINGFTKSGPNAWFGNDGYEALMREIVRLRPVLKWRGEKNGGFAIVYDE